MRIAELETWIKSLPEWMVDFVDPVDTWSSITEEEADDLPLSYALERSIGHRIYVSSRTDAENDGRLDVWGFDLGHDGVAVAASKADVEAGFDRNEWLDYTPVFH